MRDVGYVADPQLVELTPGAVQAVRLVNNAGWLAIVITNQSGIARGIISEHGYEAVRSRLDELLAGGGARLDATKYCPHAPGTGSPCECRKPGGKLFVDAAREFGIDLARSVGIGDRWRDLAPVLALGGRGILVPGEGTTAGDLGQSSSGAIHAPSLVDAVRLALDGGGFVPVRMAVLASGGGSNLQAILDDVDARGALAACRVALVASDRAAAPALDRARRHGVPTEIIADPHDSAGLVRLFEAHHIEMIALAGYLRLLPAGVIARWPRRIVNVHPALLPTFGGKGMYGARVHRAVLASGQHESGATVHLVDEEFDHGEILAQERVAVRVDDDAARLATRVLAVEHRLYPAALHRYARTFRSGATSPSIP